MATCVRCGQPIDDDDDEIECDLDCSSEEESEDVAREALSHARPGNDEEFKRQLSIAVEEQGDSEMNIVDQLIHEANEAAARGDVADARRLLDRAVHPKWESPEDCRQAYDAAMAEKRGVVA